MEISVPPIFRNSTSKGKGRHHQPPPLLCVDHRQHWNSNIGIGRSSSISRLESQQQVTYSDSRSPRRKTFLKHLVQMGSNNDVKHPSASHTAAVNTWVNEATAVGKPSVNKPPMAPTNKKKKSSAKNKMKPPTYVFLETKQHPELMDSARQDSSHTASTAAMEGSFNTRHSNDHGRLLSSEELDHEDDVHFIWQESGNSDSSPPPGYAKSETSSVSSCSLRDQLEQKIFGGGKPTDPEEDDDEDEVKKDSSNEVKQERRNSTSTSDVEFTVQNATRHIVGVPPSPRTNRRSFVCNSYNPHVEEPEQKEKEKPTDRQEPRSDEVGGRLNSERERAHHDREVERERAHHRREVEPERSPHHYHHQRRVAEPDRAHLHQQQQRREMERERDHQHRQHQSREIERERVHHHHEPTRRAMERPVPNMHDESFPRDLKPKRAAPPTTRGAFLANSSSVDAYDCVNSSPSIMEGGGLPRQHFGRSKDRQHQLRGMNQTGQAWFPMNNNRSSSPHATGEPSRQQQQSGNGSNLVELYPGIYVPLRSAQETENAIASDFYTNALCIGCQQDMFCIIDASYVMCPHCKFISPMDAYDGNNTNIRPRTGLGIGFTGKTLCEIKQKASFGGGHR